VRDIDYEDKVVLVVIALLLFAFMSAHGCGVHVHIDSKEATHAK
jgi:hypothetical protein